MTKRIRHAIATPILLVIVAAEIWRDSKLGR